MCVFVCFDSATLQCIRAVECDYALCSLFAPGDRHVIIGTKVPCTITPVAGRSGLAVSCLTAVREVLRSNRSVGSCVYRKNHCDLQPWARAVCTFPAVLGQLSLLPSVGR